MIQRFYCLNCFQYVRLFRQLSTHEITTPAPARCENASCQTGFAQLFAYEVPDGFPDDLSNPLVEATHDQITGPGPGYRPSSWRRFLQLLGLAGCLAVVVSGQDLSTFKHQEFAGWVFPPCEPKQHIACTHDADTPTVQVQTRLVGGTYKVRLRGVDAPELEQPRGREAMAALFRLLAGSKGRVYVEGRDKYGRTLGVLYNETGADINLLLVANGYAWVDRGSMPKARRRQLEAAQATARERKLGLWADPHPIEPRDWRRGIR